MSSIKLTFYGGVHSVTGANFLVEYSAGKFLVDCGLIQGARENKGDNHRVFGYDPVSVSHLFITHAHLDHLGRIPKLVKEGFSGTIISTAVTKEIAEISLNDAYRLMLAKHKKGAPPPIYERQDIDKSLSLWQTKMYGEKYEFSGIEVTLRDAGHILGSAMLEFNIDGERLLFTGDLGNSPSLLLNDTEEVKDVDYIIMESVYGDREHESSTDRRAKLKQGITDTVARGGDVVIPVFSIERTQDILYELNNMIEDGEIESIPVFLDSPMASAVTEVYKRHTNEFNERVREEIAGGDDIFSFPKLDLELSKEDSENVQKIHGPKIILAGSGMSEGGRVRSHEARVLPDPKSSVILVGYQPVGTLGRHLEDGDREVEIDKIRVKVRAKVVKIEGYSSHKDGSHLLEFVEKVAESGKLKRVFTVMGEPHAALFLCQRIKEYVGVESVYPEPSRAYNLT